MLGARVFRCFFFTHLAHVLVYAIEVSLRCFVQVLFIPRLHVPAIVAVVLASIMSV